MNAPQLDIDSQIKRTAKDSLIYMPAMVIPAIIGIVLIRILTSIFTKEEYGFYQITLSTFGLLRVFGMVWLSNSVIRFYLHHKNNRMESSFYSTVSACTFASALLIALLAFAINHYVFRDRIAAELYSLVNLAIFASIFNSFFEIFVMVFRAGLEAKKYSLLWLAFAAGKPIVGMIFILFFGFRVDGIIWGFVVVPLLLNILIFVHLDLKSKLKVSLISRSLSASFFKYGVPISFSLFSFWILSLSDRYFIEFYRGSDEVGLYSVGYVISEKTLTFIFMILMLAAYPIIIDNWEKHGDAYTQKLISAFTRYFFLICTPILVVLVTIPEYVLKIFSDVKFIDGARVLPLIAIGVYLEGLTQYVMKGFELHKKSVRIATIALIAGIANVLLNIMLIPRLGFFGAGISACSAYSLHFVMAVIAVRKEMKWNPPYRSIAMIALAAAAFALYIHAADHLLSGEVLPVTLALPGGVGLFLAMLILSKEITKDEINKGLRFIITLVR